MTQCIYTSTVQLSLEFTYEKLLLKYGISEQLHGSYFVKYTVYLKLMCSFVQMTFQLKCQSFVLFVIVLPQVSKDQLKMMNADKDRLKLLLTETITLLCQRGLTFKRELHVQGLLGITVDDDVFLVPLDNRKSYSGKQPWFINREAEAPSPCNSIPRHIEPGVHHMVTSEVPNVNSDFFTAAGNAAPPSHYPAADNDSGLLTTVKTEIPDVENIHSSSENRNQLLDNGFNENLTTSSTVQLHTAPDDVRYEGKRKRKRCKFGNDILVLSPDNDEWTDVSQREINRPVVGYSQWANYDEGLQHSVSVSIFSITYLLYMF